MSTGLETWTTNLSELGPLYPFSGAEMVLALIGVAIWVIWHIVQMKREGKLNEEEDKLFSDKAELEKSIRLSNAESLLEILQAHEKKV